MKFKFALSGNALKLIAAALMAVDHIGFMFFPTLLWLRAIGRLSFPIFAYFISEGCRYTKSRLRYFLTMAGFAVACQLVYSFFGEGKDGSVFLTFSLPILFIYTLYGTRDLVFAKERTRADFLRLFIPLLGSASATAAVILAGMNLDYGFAGALLPAFAAITHPPKAKIRAMIFRFVSLSWKNSTDINMIQIGDV